MQSFAISSINSNTDGASTSSSIPSQSAIHACAACKYQRRKCNPTCLLAPYFPANKHRQFLNAHRHFGISKILRIIRHLDAPLRSEAMATIVYESEARARDPVGGCHRIVLGLEHDLQNCSAELGAVRHLLAVCRAQAQEPHPSDTGVHYHMLSNPDTTDNGVRTNDYFSHLPPSQPPPPPPPPSPPQYNNYMCFDGVDNNDLDNKNCSSGVNVTTDHHNLIGVEGVDSKDLTAYQSSKTEH